MTREPRPTPPSSAPDAGVDSQAKREAGRGRRRCHHRPGRQARRRRGGGHGGDLRPQARPPRGHLDHRPRRRRRGRQGARHRGIREGPGRRRGDLERARRPDGRWLQHHHDLGAHRRARRHPRPAGRDRQGALPQREHRRRHRAVRRHRVAGEDDAGQRRPGAGPDEPGDQARRHRLARGRAVPPPGRPRGHPEPARRPQGLRGPVAGRGAAEHRRAGARAGRGRHRLPRRAQGRLDRLHRLGHRAADRRRRAAPVRRRPRPGAGAAGDLAAAPHPAHARWRPSRPCRHRPPPERLGRLSPAR